MKTIRTVLITSLIAFSATSFSQASLTVKNKSDRYLTVKVMKGNERKAVHYKTDSIVPKGTKVIYFTESGFYYTKNQAILFSKEDPKMNDTLYSKDRPFQVVSDSRRGYSNITMEFKVK